MDMQEMIDQEILKSMYDLCWKQCYRFAEKWSLPARTTAVLETVRTQLERDFRAAHPELEFDEEWSKCFYEVANNKFDSCVGPIVNAYLEGKL